MTDPRDLQQGDPVEIAEEPLTDLQFRVSDVEVEDIGITETFAVTLVSHADDEPNYAIVGTTADSTATLSEIDGDAEHTVFWKSITVP